MANKKRINEMDLITHNWPNAGAVKELEELLDRDEALEESLQFKDFDEEEHFIEYTFKEDVK